jgi:hypothetical protein
VSTRTALLILSALVVVALLAWLIIRGRRTGKTVASNAPPSDVYLGLRRQMLEVSRSRIGLPRPSSPTTPWGVAMDWPQASGFATVVALGDGNASIYLSGGGGYLGGVSHESIRVAAQKAVEVAGDVQPQMKPTTAYPLPERGQIVFYALTDAGTFTVQVPEAELRNGRSPFAKLGNAMQGVITQYRLLQGQQPHSK